MKKNLIVVFFVGFIFTGYGNEPHRYLFFLHNRFLEEHELDDIHPEYGKTEYQAILQEFKSSGFNVLSEKRNGNVNAREYAIGIVEQIDS